MSDTYNVRFYTGKYPNRQQQANKDKCICYVEQHLNAAASAKAGYSVVITGYNCSETSKSWGRWYAQRVGKVFAIPVKGDRGIKVGGYNGRGNSNLKHTNMPAILLEPLFGSNPQHAEWIRSEDGQNKLAGVLADSIRKFFPEGGKVGFSVGHKGKPDSDDRGAAVYGSTDMREADYAEIVLNKAAAMLVKQPVQEPAEEEEDHQICVVKNNKQIWSYADLDENDEVFWNEENRTLFIFSNSEQ